MPEQSKVHNCGFDISKHDPNYGEEAPRRP
jgi:hypothetical protein